jgi:hypothetical protein
MQSVAVFSEGVPQNPYKGSPLSTAEVNQLGEDVSNLLSNSKCAKFVTALLTTK